MVSEARAAAAMGISEHDYAEGVAHTNRFRKVSTRYPRRVNEAYGFDRARAMSDSDEQVAATVAAWEEANGLEVRDWYAIGAEERGDTLPMPTAQDAEATS